MKAHIVATYNVTAISSHFDSNEAAEAAYQKVARALDSYREYKNDRTNTVEINTTDGKVTLSLDRMDGVLLNHAVEDEAVFREAFEKEKLCRSIREDMGLPPTSKDPLVLKKDERGSL